jgi:uncharacterized repeat protein (TIGR03803 family)
MMSCHIHRQNPTNGIATPGSERMKNLFRFRISPVPVLMFFTSLVASAQAQTFTTLKSFGVLTNKAGTVTRSPLVQGLDGTLYGTTSAGGGIMRGAVFKISTNGSGFALLKQFTNLFDGAFPKSSLLLDGTTLYGTTSAGGSEDGGTIFRLNIDGTGFAVLKQLPAGSYNQNLPPPPSGGGSAHEPNPPMGGLALAGTTLYGTTRSGGTAARGTVFKLETNGSGYSVIKEFSGADGAAPTGDLVVSGSTLYGTTSYGGSANTGTVFRVNVDGTGFTTLKHFTGPDGAGPYAGLVLGGTTLYGVTVRGGAVSSRGTVFKLNTDGSGFGLLKSFGTSPTTNGIGPMGRLLLVGNVLYGTAASVLNLTPGTPTVFRVNTDGTGFAVVMSGIGNPTSPFFSSQAGLVLSGSTLYGTMTGPNVTGSGQVFSVNTNGTARTTLKAFNNVSGDDASLPGPLVLAGETLYGPSGFGGTSNSGTVFKLDTNGGSYAILKHFNPSTDGNGPRARLAFSGQTLYGVAASGGPNNWGTLFKLDENGDNFGLVTAFDGVVVGGPTALTIAGDTLFGTAGGGGPNGNGGVFKVNTDGNGFTVLKDLNDGPGYQPLDEPLVEGNTLYALTQDGAIFKVNTDGTGFDVLCIMATNAPLIFPLNRLVLAGNTLYGMAYAGTNYPAGVIYKVNTDGTGFGVLTYLTDPRLGFYTLSRGGLLISGQTMYGATRSAIFQVNTNGTGFAVVKAFGPPPDGDQPQGDLTLVGTTLYGSTAAGGEVGEGTVFRLDLRPRLSIAQSTSNVTVSWPSYATDYQLEQNSTLVSGSWSNVSGSILNDGTNRILTLPAPTGSVKYYRLRQ